jgi:hypothetical protein
MVSGDGQEVGQCPECRQAVSAVEQEPVVVSGGCLAMLRSHPEEVTPLEYPSSLCSVNCA